MRVQRKTRRAARSGSPRLGRPHCGRRRLTLETLEDRRLLAVLQVGSGAAYATIQAAVDAARPGDVVLVGDGQYAESVDLSRLGIVRSGPIGDLTIRGSSVDQAVVGPTGNAAFFNSSAFAGDLTIERLTVTGVAAGAGISGVKVQQWAGDVTVADVILDQLSDAGVDLAGVTGRVRIESSRFDRVGDSVQDAAIRLGEVSGAGAILSNDFEDGMGVAVLLSSSTGLESTWLVDGNRIYGDGSLFSTTDTGMRVRLGGDSVTDLTLNHNDFDGLAGSAIDVEVQEQAALQTRWSANTAGNLQGSAAARLMLRGEAAGALLAENNSWNDVFGSGVSVQVEGAADLRAIVQYDAFTSIGDGQGAVHDEALKIETAANATGNVDLLVFNNTFSTVTGNGLRITAGGAAAVRAVVTDNAFDECNTVTADGALVVEHGAAVAGASLDLRLVDNSSFRHREAAYLLRQRGTGVLRLEGTAATAAAQIAARNIGAPVTVTGAVGMIAPGQLDANLPLIVGDTVWQDDGDAIQNQGEAGVAGVVIRLSGSETAGGAAVNRITQTDTSGTYLFPGLAAGQYTLTLEVPFAMRLATADVGIEDAIDSDFDPASAQAAVVLVAAVDDSTVDAGLWSTWQNPRNPLDVNDDGVVQPLDALVMINDINARQSRPLPIPPVPPSVPPPFLDVSGNGAIGPQDVLIVINYLNSVVMGGAGEGEAEEWAGARLDVVSAGSKRASFGNPMRVVRGSPDPAQAATVRSQESGRPAVSRFGEVGRPAPSGFGEVGRPAPSARLVDELDGLFAQLALAEGLDQILEVP